MGIPLAALGAVVAALLETSVIASAAPTGPRVDLVLVLTVVVSVVFAAEDGMVAAFVGGFILDVLEPQRHLGASSLVLLVAAGLALAIGRLLPQRGVPVLAGSVFVLSWVYQVLSTLALAVSAGTPGRFDLTQMATTAVLDGLTGAVAAIAALSAWRRFGQHDRIEW